jgi:hypothetical protein
MDEGRSWTKEGHEGRKDTKVGRTRKKEGHKGRNEWREGGYFGGKAVIFSSVRVELATKGQLVNPAKLVGINQVRGLRGV